MELMEVYHEALATRIIARVTNGKCEGAEFVFGLIESAIRKEATEILLIPVQKLEMVRIDFGRPNCYYRQPDITRAQLEVLQLCRSGRISWADMVLAPSVAGLFKWRQFEPEVILLAVGWYLGFSLSYRDVEELLAERGLHADHVTVWRWVQRYAPKIQRRLRPRLRPTNDSWRVDETYIRVKGKWVYLYRAVDSTGATIDFLLSAKRDAAAAERFLAKALSGANHPAPRVINTDKHAGYPSAIVRLKAEEALEENCRHRPVQYLNNVLEQDHRAIKRRVRASQHFRSFWGAWRTIAGYEAIHMIRKGQACWSAAGAKLGLLHHFILGLFAATS
jgi:transposase, IS6 family